jgi:hypothetical protein
VAVIVVVVVIILMVIVGAVLIKVGPVDDGNVDTILGDGNKIVQIAEKEVGICGTGCQQNGGIPDSRYKAFTGCPGECVPWCAAFVSWVYKQAGYNYPRSCFVWDLKTDSRVKSFEMSNKNSSGWPPKPGDILIRDCGYGGGHTGIVVQYNSNGMLTYIDGNGGPCVKKATDVASSWCYFVRLKENL